MASSFKATLRDDVLRAASASNTSRVAISGMTRQETVYTLPEGTTQEDKITFFLHLVAVGTAETKERGEWRNFVLTIINLAFPGIGSKFLGDQPRLYKVSVLATGDIEAMKAYKEICDEWAKVPAAEITTREEARQSAAEAFPRFDGLPTPSSKTMSPLLAGCASIEAMYGYVSLVLFLAGKTINDTNRGAVTTRRPSAIERKYGLGTVPCLSGDLKMSNTAHEYIHTAFVTMNHARLHTFGEVAKFSNETGDVGVEIAATTTRLMAYSGMQHVILIDRFLSSEADVEVIPILASSLVAYAASLEELRKTPVELRPFHKLMHGDTTQAFNRKNVEPLMVVAIKLEAETNPTLANYNLPENNNEIMTAYWRYKKQLE